MTDTIDRMEDWPLRPWLLAGLGAVAGLLMHFVLDRTPWAAWQGSAASFIAAFAVLTGFTAERVRSSWAIGFALVSAAVIASIFWWNGAPDDWDDAGTWRVICVFLSVAIAAPLLQTARDEGGARFPYAKVHDHAWANVVIWCASCAFVGVVFLLVLLLSELFALIGIDLLRDALREEWFGFTVAGGAFGAAVGVFRERDQVMRVLLKVITAVLGVLAPVLGVGLLIFIVSLPFTGLSALWDATRSTTPILLSCVIGALILCNVVIGDSAEDEAKAPVLRWSAMALALAMLPLAAIAAVSTGARIQQYGFTPDRLWALVFVIVASAYGLAYLVSLVRGRMDWAAHVRPANLRLAFGTCALALFLALPILSFNAISTRDQVARLESGRIAPDKFDWAALRFDFGEPGRAALKRLAGSANPEIRKQVAMAQKGEHRWDVQGQAEQARRADALAGKVVILPQPVALPEGLIEAFNVGDVGNSRSFLVYRPGDTMAALVLEGCNDCEPRVLLAWRNAKGEWQEGGLYLRREDGLTSEARTEKSRKLRDALRKGAVEVRSIERRQIFIDGEPVGEPFE